MKFVPKQGIIALLRSALTNGILPSVKREAISLAKVLVQHLGGRELSSALQDLPQYKSLQSELEKCALLSEGEKQCQVVIEESVIALEDE
jgi:hypothetical protein